jgi:hypothetical protein
MSIFSKAWKSVKKISQSPILKVVAGVVAIAVPAVGVPALAALTLGNKVLSAAHSADHVVAARAKQLIANTKHAAAQGHPEAIRGLNALKIAAAHRKGDPRALRMVARLQQQHQERQTRARRVAAKYKVHPRTGRLVKG